jgi:hypothetical protein
MPVVSSYRPDFPTHPIWRAGLPAIKAKFGTFFESTSPVPIIAHLPIFIGATQTAPELIDAPTKISTLTFIQFSVPLSRLMEILSADFYHL